MSQRDGVDRAQVVATSLDAVDLLATAPAAPEFIVRPLVPQRSIVLVTGDVGAGKTAFMLHVAVAVAKGLPVAGAFDVTSAIGPVLYVNGEMGTADVRRYLAMAQAGLDATLPRGRLFFEGNSAVADFRLGAPEQRDALTALIEQLRPSLVVLDTMRALLEIDETETAEVRGAFGWLRYIANAYNLSIVVSHHLRKISAVSNTDRERVAGSRDILASVDVHLAARSSSGRVAHALVLDKTRTPFDGVERGTEWALNTRLEFDNGVAVRSIFVAQRVAAKTSGTSRDEARHEIRARLELDGPLTIEQLGADRGSRKRAYDGLRRDGEVIEVGKDGRRRLYGLRGVHEPEDDAAQTRSHSDRAPDRVPEKSSNDNGFSAVSFEPRLDRDGQSRADTPPRLSEPRGGGDARRNECGQRSQSYRDRTR